MLPKPVAVDEFSNQSDALCTNAQGAKSGRKGLTARGASSAPGGPALSLCNEAAPISGGEDEDETCAGGSTNPGDISDEDSSGSENWGALFGANSGLFKKLNGADALNAEIPIHPVLPARAAGTSFTTVRPPVPTHSSRSATATEPSSRTTRHPPPQWRHCPKKPSPPSLSPAEAELLDGSCRAQPVDAAAQPRGGYGGSVGCSFPFSLTVATKAPKRLVHSGGVLSTGAPYSSGPVAASSGTACKDSSSESPDLSWPSEGAPQSGPPSHPPPPADELDRWQFAEMAKEAAGIGNGEKLGGAGGGVLGQVIDLKALFGESGADSSQESEADRQRSAQASIWSDSGHSSGLQAGAPAFSPWWLKGSSSESTSYTS